MDKIIKQFHKICQNRPDQFGGFYSDNITAIADWLEKREGLKTSYKLFDLDKQADWISFSLIFSDTLILYPLGNYTLKITLPKGQSFKKNIESLTLPKELYNEISSNEVLDKLLLGYINCDSGQLKDFTYKLKTLIKNEKVLLCPDRIALKVEDDPEQIGHKRYHGIPVVSDSSFNKWILTPDNEKLNSLPLIENMPKPEMVNELYSLSIPYLSGSRFNDLSKVLDDNLDCLSILRSHLKNTITEYRDSKTIKEIHEDLIRPEIDKLNIRFKKIQNMHRMRIAGVVLSTSTIALALYEKEGVLASIIELLGAGGFGLLRSENKYQEAIMTMKEEPLYLFWKLKALRK
jgi:hypothetical protein